MHSRVDVSFECLPLRDVARLDVPLDASEQYQQFVLMVKRAIDEHGRHNTYFLSRGHCVYFLTNEPDLGEITFHFYGTVFTDADDVRCVGADLTVEFASETCPWLIQSVIDWMLESVTYTVKSEFDRYIRSGDLQKARQLAAERLALANEAGGFLGMYL
jgi:hypothetical protein